RPNLNKIRIFGCETYTKILESLKKLDERNKKLELVGYTENNYKLWDNQERKIVIRRDVIFTEVTKEDEETNKRQIIELQKDQENEEDQKRSIELKEA
ncbi:Copia protein, partial [Melipona quadrifasciata]